MGFDSTRYLAFAKVNPNYAIYYLFDEEKKTVKRFSNHDTSVLAGIYTGELSDGIDIHYIGGDMHDTIRYKDCSHSVVILTESNGFDWEFSEVDATEALAVLCQDGYHEIVAY